MIQETISLDGLIDKLLRYNYNTPTITSIVNAVFSNSKHIDADYVSQRMNKIRAYQDQLMHLMAIPKIEQRSEEWHNVRKSIVTASEFAQALGKAKFGTQKQWFQKKSGYEVDKFDASSPPLKWGTMYEPAAGDIYCKRMGAEMHEFGLIKHPTIKHFGASPDGITDFGIMVEIKCPYQRKITGEVPQQYYFQMQGQLDTCGLDECDYTEFEFIEYHDLEDWLKVTQPVEKGVIIETNSNDPFNPYSYQYSTIWNGSDDVEELRKTASTWIKTNSPKDGSSTVLHFWTIGVFNIVRVYRNQAFLEEKMLNLEDIWKKLENYRVDQELYTKEVAVKRVRRSSKEKVADVEVASGYAFLDDES